MAVAASTSSLILMPCGKFRINKFNICQYKTAVVITVYTKSYCVINIIILTYRRTKIIRKTLNVKPKGKTEKKQDVTDFAPSHMKISLKQFLEVTNHCLENL